MLAKVLNFIEPWVSRSRISNRQASILALSLWSICLLSVLAVILNSIARQKILLIQRLDIKDRLSLVAEAGVKRAIVELAKQGQVTYYTLKDPSSDNIGVFKDAGLGNAVFNVSYNISEQPGLSSIRWGFIDEERKVNINLAGLSVLKRLFQIAAYVDEIQAQDLASAIVDWRDSDDMLSSASGGAEGPYYRNLNYPYEAKNAEFEVLDELLLVKGMSEEIFEKIKDYITIYGEGKININTASRTVLLAWGLNAETVDKILMFRNGRDGLEATADDNIFDIPSNIAALVNQYYHLDEAEKAQLSSAQESFLVTNSYFFLIKSSATLNNRKEKAEVISIVDMDGKILYWNQS
jgi:general secretion pathway protein K